MKYENTFKIIFIFLFVIFLTMYISVGSNYYEYELHKKVMLTNEDIKKFEDDVKNNKEVDIDNYISSRVDYSNSFFFCQNLFSVFLLLFISIYFFLTHNLFLFYLYHFYEILTFYQVH